MEETSRQGVRSCQSVGARKKQTGVALYLMLIVAILVSTELTSTQINAQLISHNIQRQQRLKFAKENLIALAVNYADNYGPSGAGPMHLPCANQKIPDGDRSTEGPDTPCSGEQYVIGRLPRLVGIDHRLRVLNYQPDQYDAHNALWYIVSNNFTNSPFKKLNSETQAELSFNGLSNVLAIVFDAGQAIGSQADMRPSSDYRAYLELEQNGSDILLSDDSNDRYLAITLNDILPLVSERVSANVARWLSDYRNRRCSGDEVHEPCFPWSAILPNGMCSEGAVDGWIAVEGGDCTDALFPSGPIEEVPRWAHWFMRNKWFEQVRYEVDESCLGMAYRECDVITGNVVHEGLLRPLLTVAPRQ